MNASVSTMEHIAELLPPDRRERFFELLAKFRNVPEDDEFLMLVEAVGFSTLLLQNVPQEVRSILDEKLGYNALTEAASDHIESAIKKSFDVPSFRELRDLLSEMQALTAKEIEASQRLIPAVQAANRVFRNNTARSLRAVVVMAVVAVLVATSGIAYGVYHHFQAKLNQVAQAYPEISELVTSLSNQGVAVDYYEGTTEADNRPIKAVIVDGQVERVFVNKAGNGVIVLKE